MSRIAYVNGRYVNHRDACVHIEDRGYQLSDAVYEVVTVCEGRVVDRKGHLARLERSLSELRIPMPMSRRVFELVIDQMIRRNRLRNGLVYFQVSRGVAPRDHAFPENVRPAVVMTVKHIDPRIGREKGKQGVKVITYPDKRWLRRDIKSVGLLWNVLAKQAAREAGAYEAFLVDEDGFITEGSSTNAWIVDEDGNLITRQADDMILRGITRLAVMELAREQGVEIVERPFTVEELKNARGVFLTSSSSFVMPVVQVDDTVIGNGKPLEMIERLRSLYYAYMQQEHAEKAAGF